MRGSLDHCWNFQKNFPPSVETKKNFAPAAGWKYFENLRTGGSTTAPPPPPEEKSLAHFPTSLVYYNFIPPKSYRYFFSGGLGGSQNIGGEEFSLGGGGGSKNFPPAAGFGWGEAFGGQYSKSGGLELSKVAPSNAPCHMSYIMFLQ